jgi:hypothetical protein
VVITITKVIITRVIAVRSTTAINVVVAVASGPAHTYTATLVRGELR